MNDHPVSIPYVHLCVYERPHGTFYTLGSRVIAGPFLSPSGKPTRTYKISLKDLHEIIKHTERTGEPE